MFTQHPKHSEFFDYDDFVRENMTTLRDLYEQAKVHVGDDPDDWDGKMAVFVAAAVYADVDKIEPPVPYEQEDEEGICDLANNLVVLMVLFSLEDKGMITRKGDKISLTEQGLSYAEDLKKLKQDATFFESLMHQPEEQSNE